MNILAPAPVLGWNSVYRGPVDYVSFSPRLLGSGDQYTVDLGFRISGDGETYRNAMVRGDLAQYVLSGPGQPGVAVPTQIARFGNKLFLACRIIDNREPDLNHDNRGMLFSSDDGKTWDQVVTGIEGSVGGKRYFVDIAVTATRLAVLSSEGHVADTTDGEAFTSRGTVGFTGSQPALCIAGHDSSGYAVGGIDGQLKTASFGSSSWTARTSQFGSSDINRLVAGNVFVAAGEAGKVSTCPTNNLASWTARSSGVASELTFLVYGNSRWFMGQTNTWLTSTDGASWSAQAEPWGSSSGSPFAGVWDGTDWSIFISSGRLAQGDGSGSWELIDEPNLPTSGISMHAAYRGAA